jgi:hypothetical protein
MPGPAVLAANNRGLGGCPLAQQAVSDVLERQFPRGGEGWP